jgi:hypothetical protein
MSSTNTVASLSWNLQWTSVNSTLMTGQLHLEDRGCAAVSGGLQQCAEKSSTASELHLPSSSWMVYVAGVCRANVDLSAMRLP